MHHELLTIVFFFALLFTAATVINMLNVIIEIAVSMYQQRTGWKHTTSYLWLVAIFLWTLFYFLN